MNESITSTTNHFSPAASLAALGVKLSQLDLFGPIRTQVQIKQKTVKHTPTDKLYDAFISLLAGTHGLVESIGGGGNWGACWLRSMRKWWWIASLRAMSS